MLAGVARIGFYRMHTSASIFDGDTTLAIRSGRHEREPADANTTSFPPHDIKVNKKGTCLVANRDGGGRKNDL